MSMSAHDFNVADPERGYYDVCYSPDDGGWYADLLFDPKADCPTLDSAEAADAWARQNGGKYRLR